MTPHILQKQLESNFAIVGSKIYSMVEKNNPLKDNLELYTVADFLLGMLATRYNGYMYFHQIEEELLKLNVVEFLTANKFVKLIENGGSKVLILTKEGISHWQNGGFLEIFASTVTAKQELTFSKHLEANSALIGIFAAFNAVIIFASSGEAVGKYKPDSYIRLGVTFLNLALYVMSAQVLVEIIKNTRHYIRQSEFALFYLCMCGVELGIGLIFLEKHIVIILGTACMFLVHILSKVITAHTDLEFWFPFKFEIKRGERKEAFWLCLSMLIVSFLLLTLYGYPMVVEYIFRTWLNIHIQKN